MMDATELLVDGHHGIYTYHELARRYPVFVQEGEEYILLDSKLAKSPEYDADLSNVFHPDNDSWCENIDHFSPLYIKSDKGEFWLVDSRDGDLFAVHPDAEWNEETETYELKGE